MKMSNTIPPVRTAPPGVQLSIFHHSFIKPLPAATWTAILTSPTISSGLEEFTMASILRHVMSPLHSDIYILYTQSNHSHLSAFLLTFWLSFLSTVKRGFTSLSFGMPGIRSLSYWLVDDITSLNPLLLRSCCQVGIGIPIKSVECKFFQWAEGETVEPQPYLDPYETNQLLQTQEPQRHCHCHLYQSFSSTKVDQRFRE